MRLPLASLSAAGLAAVAFVVAVVGQAPASIVGSSLVALTTAPPIHTEPPDPRGVHTDAPTVTSVALTSSDGTNVSCPATIHVTANVTGTAGTYLHVVVRGFFNGSFVTIDGTQSMPDTQMLTTGTYTRTFAVALPVLTGEPGDGIVLTAWQNGDTFPFNTPSDSAQFVPTCKAPPTAPPTATPAPTPAPGSDLGIPTDLIAVHSTQTCQGLVLASVVGSGCASAVQKGELVLAWSYTSLSHCGSHCATPTGFVVERAGYEGGAYQAYQLVAYDPKTPAADGIIMSTVPYATTFGQCYRVSALRGDADQGLSSTPMCIKPDPVTLNAVVYSANVLEHTKSGALCSPDANPIGIALAGQVSSNEFLVGFRDSETFSSAAQCFEEYYQRWQADLVFPVDTLPLKKVAHATLTATVVNGAFSPGQSDPNSSSYDGPERAVQVNCVAHVGYPTNFKPGESAPERITYDDFADPTPAKAATTVSIDVTGMVQAWLRPGGVNNGMVLSAQVFNGGNGYSSFHDLPQSPVSQECIAIYSNPKLTITY
jgi:hypothetical protein